MYQSEKHTLEAKRLKDSGTAFLFSPLPGGARDIKLLQNKLLTHKRIAGTNVAIQPLASKSVLLHLSGGAGAKRLRG